GKSGEQRSFFQLEVAGMLVEVIFGAGFKAIDAVSQEDLVGGEREDLLLGEVALNLHGQHGFLDLAAEVPLGRKKQVAAPLHGQRGRPFSPTVRLNVAPGGACHAPEVDSPMALKILVFGGEDGVAQDLGDVVILGEHAALQGERANYTSLGVIKFGDSAGTVLFQFADLGQVSGVDDQKSHQGAGHGSGGYQQPDHHAANNFPSRQLKAREIRVRELHGRETLKLRIAWFPLSIGPSATLAMSGN